jgi:hypothetical protein
MDTNRPKFRKFLSLLFGTDRSLSPRHTQIVLIYLDSRTSATKTDIVVLGIVLGIQPKKGYRRTVTL